MRNSLFVGRADRGVLKERSRLIPRNEGVINRVHDAIGPHDLQGEQERRQGNIPRPEARWPPCYQCTSLHFQAARLANLLANGGRVCGEAFEEEDRIPAQFSLLDTEEKGSDFSSVGWYVVSFRQNYSDRPARCGRPSPRRVAPAQVLIPGTGAHVSSMSLCGFDERL